MKTENKEAIREEAVKWFDNLPDDVKKTVACMYFHVIDTEFIAATLTEYVPKEHEIKEVSNVSEIKEGSLEWFEREYPETEFQREEKAVREGNLDYFIKKEEPVADYRDNIDYRRINDPYFKEPVFNMEDLVKAADEQGVGKEEPVSVSVEKAAKDLALLERNKKQLSNREFDFCKNYFKEGANWQKEQDKAIIGELLDIVNAMRLAGKVEGLDSIMVKTYEKMKSVIAKAETYLQTKN